MEVNQRKAVENVLNTEGFKTTRALTSTILLAKRTSTLLKFILKPLQDRGCRSFGLRFFNLTALDNCIKKAALLVQFCYLSASKIVNILAVVLNPYQNVK